MSVTYVCRQTGLSEEAAQSIFSFVKKTVSRSSAVTCERPLGIFFSSSRWKIAVPNAYALRLKSCVSTCRRAALVDSSYVILLIIQESQHRILVLLVIMLHRSKGQSLTMLSTLLNNLPQFSHSHVIMGLCFASCRARSFLLENPPSVDCGHPSCRQNSVFECRL